MNSPVRLRISPTATILTAFSVRGFEALFPHTGTLVWCVSLPTCSSWFIRTQMWDHTVCQLPPCPVLQLLPCQESSPPSWPSLPLLPVWMNVSSFNSLVVGLPYSSIVCQFWLFFVFKFGVVLLLVVQGGTVCLPMPPSWPRVLGRCILFHAKITLIF